MIKIADLGSINTVQQVQFIKLFITCLKSFLLNSDGRLFYQVMQQINQFSHQIDKERNILKRQIINRHGSDNVGITQYPVGKTFILSAYETYKYFLTSCFISSRESKTIILLAYLELVSLT